MVIDINLLRKDRGGDPEIVLQSERDRFRSTDRVNNILVLDEKWRELRHKLDTLNKNKNLCSKFFGKKAKEKGGNSNPNTTNPCNINISNNTTQTSNTTANLTETPTASNLAILNPLNFNPIISNPINENNSNTNLIKNNNSNINPVNTNNNKNNIIVNPIINNNSNTNLIKNNNSNINPITDDINNNRHDNPIINNNSNINPINDNNSNIKLITDNNNNNNLTNPNNNTINNNINNKINDNNNLININNINIDLLNITNDLLDKLNINELKTLSKTIDAHVINLTNVLKTTEDERDCLLREVGNLLHRTVPISSDEDNNAAVRFCGDHTKIAEHSHVDLLLMIDGADYKRGVAVAGNRGYFLKGPAVFLAHALVDYSLKLLYDKDFVPLYTPFFMKKNLMSAVAQLSQFDDELYKVVSKSENKYDDSTTSDDKYLIATSEQTIASFHKDEWLSPDSLPLKYAGISTCFRQEVGSHGRDTTGIFRVHQFEKVEQFVICSPLNDESWRHLDLMIQNAEELCKNLGFGYRIVSIVSGALNNAAAKKLDLEAWFPGSKAFRELVSCSNCTDYQSRSLGIRFGCTKQLNKEVKFVHMLNCTMCAVTRYLCCLLETHQTDKGINVPACLHPYIPENLKFIPFVRTVEEVRKLQ